MGGKAFANCAARATHDDVFFYGDQQRMIDGKMCHKLDIQRFYKAHIDHGGFESLSCLQGHRGQYALCKTAY